MDKRICPTCKNQGYIMVLNKAGYPQSSACPDPIHGNRGRDIIEQLKPSRAEPNDVTLNLSQDIEQQIYKAMNKLVTDVNQDTGRNVPTIISISSRKATSALTQLFNKRLIEELDDLFMQEQLHYIPKAADPWAERCIDRALIADRIAQLKEAQQ